VTGGTHRISLAEFDALAAGEGNASGVLRAVEGSLRLVLLHTVITAARRHRPDELAESGAAAGLDLITELHRVDQAAVTEALLHPPLGTWGMHCLHRLGGGVEPPGPSEGGTGEAVDDGPSLAADLGYLAGAAAAAAVRVGIPFELRVLARDGLVHLPGLGTAAVGSDGWYVIHGGSSGTVVAGPGLGREPIRVDAADERWLPVRRLRSMVDGLGLDVALDDVDPFRGFGGLAPRPRLDQATVGAWERRLDEAWRQLVRHHRPQAEVIRDYVTCLVPTHEGPTGQESSGSSGHAFGAVALTTPSGGPAFALALVHETQHGKLSALSHLVRLVDGTSPTPCYAPWRPDPRPPGGLLQGCYAYLGVTDYWLRRRAALEDADEHGAPRRQADFEFARWRQAVLAALDSVVGSGQLTRHGERFVDGMRQRLGPMLDVPVRPWIERLAADVAASHLAGWQLRNVIPDEAATELTAADWRAATPSPRGLPPARVPPTGARHVRDVREKLAHLRIQDPDRFAELASRPALLALEVSGARPGDVLLIAGHHAESAASYVADIQAGDPGDGWAGLAAASRRMDGAGAEGLYLRPAHVAALHGAVRRTANAPDPLALARWLGRSTELTSPAPPGWGPE